MQDSMDFDVIILAGGLGTRLRPVVGGVPKCLAPIAGRPFLAWLLAWLKPLGPGRVVLSVGYLHEAVEAWARENARDYPFEFIFSVEDEPLDTGGGIRLALGRCSFDKVLIINGDTFFNVDLSLFSTASRGPVSIALKPMEDFDRYGEVVIDGEGRITAFREKTHCPSGLINGGIYLADRTFLLSLMSSLPQRFSFEKDVLEPLAGSRDGTVPAGNASTNPPFAPLSPSLPLSVGDSRSSLHRVHPVLTTGGQGSLEASPRRNGCITGVVCDNYFIDIGVPEDYARAEKELPQVAEIMKVAERAARYETVFLDRDGVINRQIVGDYVRKWEDFEFLPGVFDFFRKIAGSRVLVVTNQRGVGRGLMSEDDLRDIHGRMVAGIEAHGGKVDGIYYCISADPDDPCRKPAIGMFLQAKKDWPDIDPRTSVMVGDGDVDRDFAAACGMDFIRVGENGE